MATKGQPDPGVQNEPVANAEKIEVGNQTDENNSSNADPSPKKSYRFWLAFAGIASSLFVFQLDAMILGIALPVSTPFLRHIISHTDIVSVRP